MTEFVYLRIPRSTMERIRLLRDLEFAKTGKKKTLAEIVSEAIDFALKNKKRFVSNCQRNRA